MIDLRIKHEMTLKIKQKFWAGLLFTKSSKGVHVPYSAPPVNKSGEWVYRERTVIHKIKSLTILLSRIFSEMKKRTR